MKRARGNGGAREQLRPEGILVLGHQDTTPSWRERFVSPCRGRASSSRPGWSKSRGHRPAVQPAPEVPRRREAPVSP
ncbi:NaeI family type II restriction endonuclease [Geodermatophilus sp. SYSU D00758]